MVRGPGAWCVVVGGGGVHLSRELWPVCACIHMQRASSGCAPWLLRVWHPPHPRLSVHDAARAAPRSAGSHCSSSAPAAPVVRSVTRLAAARRHPASAAHHLQQRPRVATRLLCAAAAPPAARFWPGSCWPGSSERPGSSEGKPGCEAQNRASRSQEWKNNVISQIHYVTVHYVTLNSPLRYGP